jgi:hypothetical protein
MRISKVYYEELRSVCIDGKWTSKKIGAEVEIKGADIVPEGLYFAKEFVRKELDKEVEIEDNKKYKKAFEKVRKSLENEVDIIEEDEMPF